MKIKHNVAHFEEVTAEGLREGDQILIKHYDERGEWTEELWTVRLAHHRQYGRGGLRVFIGWNDEMKVSGYKRTHHFARVID